MKKIKIKFLSWIDRFLGTSNVNDYKNSQSKKIEIIENVNHEMNRRYINQLQKEVNKTRREEPESYDFRYVDTLEDIISLLKKYQLKQVRKSAKDLMNIHKNHPSVVRAYSYFLWM